MSRATQIVLAIVNALENIDGDSARELITAIEATEKALANSAPMPADQIETIEHAPAPDRNTVASAAMVEALNSTTYKWRTVGALSRLANVSESEARAILATLAVRKARHTSKELFGLIARVGS